MNVVPYDPIPQFALKTAEGESEAMSTGSSPVSVNEVGLSVDIADDHTGSTKQSAAKNGSVALVVDEEVRNAEITSREVDREKDGHMNMPKSGSSGRLTVKERWKLALRQLVFMKRMNMHFTDRVKNEIELRQQNITPLSLLCSVPYFNGFSAEEMRALVTASRRRKLLPGESLSIDYKVSLQDQLFYIIISGNLALVKDGIDDAQGVRQAELSPQLKLGIGDYFANHTATNMKVIAMELVEYLVLPLQVIAQLSDACRAQIESETNDWSCDTSEISSYKHWAMQFARANRKCEYPSTEIGGVAKCSAKAFCKDRLPHISPENELDHTLEYVKNAMISVFSAQKVRIYAFDHANNRFIPKYSSQPLLHRSFDGSYGIGRQVLEKRGPVFVAKASELLQNHDDAIIKELYHGSDAILAAPFFAYDPMGTRDKLAKTTKIVGVLELVIGSEERLQPVNSTPATPTRATENDFCILDIITNEVGRYLFFHYEDFFEATMNEEEKLDANPSITHELTGQDIEILPILTAPSSYDTRQLIVSINLFEFDIPEAISHLTVSIQLGELSLSHRNISVDGYPTIKDKSATQASPSKPSSERLTAEMGMLLSDIPHGSHLRVLAVNKSDEIVGWTGIHLFDFGHALRTGQIILDVNKHFSVSDTITPLDIENCVKRDRPNKKNVIGSAILMIECSGSSDQAFSYSSLTKKKSMTFRASIFYNSDVRIHNNGLLKLQTAKKQTLLAQLRSDPIFVLSEEDRKFLWDSRYVLIEDSALLPKFLLSVDWSKRDTVLETYRLLLLWRQPTYLEALQLLNPQYADPKVRAYAVRCMHSLPDHRLSLYLLQLVQALKNERYHDSALARFLLMRALKNPSQIGYLLYWFLKAEAHNAQTSARFELMISQYLQLCGSYKLEIRQSVYVMKKLEEIATMVKLEHSSAVRLEKLQEQLHQAMLPEIFQLPLHPRTYCTSIIAENCRVMESKKRPLFLQLEYAKSQHGRPFVIFKSGDDLRQDQLVLQILRVMDDLWREADLDLCLSPYACIATGDEIGLIEVVEDSETLAKIIYQRHDKSRTKIGRKLKSATDALVRDGVISDWLFKKDDAKDSDAVLTNDSEYTSTLPVTPPSSPVRMQPPSSCFPLSPTSLIRGMRKKGIVVSRDTEITQNFVRSCAGYCVATYVLGIGDRHNDNIMLQRSGKLFHIDFGHFLGNFKSKLGVKRERAPFIFTPSMLDAMGGRKSENYQEFKRLCCEAFCVLRRHSNLLITLLVLALTCRIPELKSISDIKWVHKTLMLDLPDEEAEKRFKKLIGVALRTKTTKLNDAVHLMAH